MAGVAVVIGGIASAIVYEVLPLKTILMLDAMTFVAAATVFVVFSRTRKPNKVQTKKVDHASKRRPAFSSKVMRTIVATSGFLLAARFMEAFGSSTHNVGSLGSPSGIKITIPCLALVKSTL